MLVTGAHFSCEMASAYADRFSSNIPAKCKVSEDLDRFRVLSAGRSSLAGKEGELRALPTWRKDGTNVSADRAASWAAASGT